MRWILGGLSVLMACAIVGMFVQNAKINNERNIYVESYMIECLKDKPEYECKMQVAMLRAAWSSRDSADAAMAMGASALAISAARR